MALFKKSYAEQSEAFVREKFAEPQAFGRPDIIEEWLAGQRAAMQPDVPVWTPIVKCQDFLDRFPSGALAVIRENADYVKDMPSFDRVSNPAPALWGVAEALYLMLPPDRVKAYRGEQHVVFDNGTNLPVVLVEYDDDRGSCHAGDFANGWEAGDILLYTWKNGGQRSLRARLYLCDFLAAWIDALRRASQSDFDRAVAVSEDGTKIVQADTVVVFDDSGRHHYYAPESFFTQKILRISGMERKVCSHGGIGDIDQWITEYLTPLSGLLAMKQALFVVSGTQPQSVLVTHKKFCPEVLPAPLPEPAKA